MGNEQSAGGPARGNLPQGMQAMGSQLQRKFAKGVQYNMKVIIKGDRNTGKTCLLKRLQGDKFHESYVPTQEIQAASIHWNYRASDDVVKVEVWDVVDKGIAAQRKRSGSLKLQNVAPGPEPTDEASPNLDAGFVDVYKNTNGVIMTMDICKAWTWKYVQREVQQVPHHIPVIILGNFRDMGEHRVVERDEVEYFIRSVERPENAGEIHYAEVSMKNAFGLKFLHKFFNLPFLRLQRATLLAQLKTNEQDLASTLEELNFHLESEEQNYDVFMTGLEKRRKEYTDRLAQQTAEAEAAGNGAATAAGQQAALAGKKPSPTTAARTTGIRPSPPTAAAAASAAPTARQPQAPAPASTSGAGPMRPTSAAMPTAQQRPPAASAPPAVASSPASATTTPTPAAPGQSFSRRFASKLGWKKDSGQASKSVDDPAAAQIAAAREARLRGAPPAVQENVEDFIPDGGLGDDFLGEDAGAVSAMAAGAPDDEEDDSDDGRPAVAGFDDFESDDDDVIASRPQVAADTMSDDDSVSVPAIAGNDDTPSIDEAPAVVAVADDFDSEPSPPPSPPPVKKTAKPKSKATKPLVLEDAVMADFDDPSPPVQPKTRKISPSGESQTGKSSPKIATASATKPKKKPAKKAVVVSSSEPSDSEDNAGPVVAPLEGDSDGEVQVDKVIAVTDDDDLGAPEQASGVASGFMEHWLDGGAMPPTMTEQQPAQPVSAYSFLGDAPLVPEAANPEEKPKKKKKKKSGDGEASAADGIEKKKKKKKAQAIDDSEEVKKKPKKKKPKEGKETKVADKKDDPYYL